MKGKLLLILAVLPHYIFSTNNTQSLKQENLNLNKIKSSIIWSAIGDSLGRITEFKNTDQIYKQYPNGIKSFDDFKKEDFYNINNKKIALYTDDTQMSMMVLKSCLKSKKENLDLNKTMEDLASRFIKWVNDPDGGNIYSNNGLSYLRAPGNTCIAACKELEKRKNERNYFFNKYPNEESSINYFAGFMHRVSGIKPETTKLILSDEWWQCGKGHKSFIDKEGGSGAIMRAWPFGLTFYNEPTKASLWAAQHSKLTHRNSISLAACAAIAIGVAYAMQNKTVEFITKEMITEAKKYDLITATMIQESIKLAKDSKQSDIKVLKKFQGWAAHEAIAATTYIFNKYSNDILKAIDVAVNSDGDSDTIATLVGALVGAYKGDFNKIKEEWLNQLESSKELLILSENFFSTTKRKLLFQ